MEGGLCKDLFSFPVRIPSGVHFIKLICYAAAVHQTRILLAANCSLVVYWKANYASDCTLEKLKRTYSFPVCRS